MLLCIRPLTFISVLKLMSSVASTMLRYSSWQMFTACCITKATLIYFINGKCHIKQLKSKKIHKMCLTNHTQSILHRIMPLIINSLGGGYIQTYTDAWTKAISRNHVHWPQGLKTHFKFKKGVDITIKSKETSIYIRS